MTSIPLAFIAGFLTVLAPCTLPILPIVLGVGAKSKTRPLFVILGFVVTYTVAGMAFIRVGQLFGLNSETLRTVAAIILIIFGASLLFPKLYQNLTSGLSSRFQQLSAKVQSKGKERSEWIKGLLIGVSLGLVWVPCVGPILGSILTLAADTQSIVSILPLFFAYALGAGLPMLGLAYGGTWATNTFKRIGANTEILHRIFGILIILAAIAILTGYDRRLQSFLLQYYPGGNVPL
jgi:cytochrome c biogenesis protein CcdA